MKTVGFGDWNIDLVRSRSVLDDVADRLAHLDQIATIKATAKPLWSALRQTQDTAMAQFAKRVREYASDGRAGSFAGTKG